MSPPTCIIIPLHAKVVRKVVDPTSTPSNCSSSLGYDCHILSFVDVEGGVYWTCQWQIQGNEDDRDIYETCIHGSILTILDVLITL